MYFNSVDFAIFLPLVFLCYWIIPKRYFVAQNVLLVVASYVFYGFWDWRFLGLILFSTLLDFSIGWALRSEKREARRKTLLWLSIGLNLGILGFFKYYNFFVESFVDAFSFFGTEIQANSLDVILPVGISFYTFQTLSYTIDVYRKQLYPTTDFIAFSAFVSFFPQLVAGPIERAKHLLPQFTVVRSFDYTKAVDGMRQILWGLFKKMVIADNCAEVANTVFANSDNASGSTLAVGAIFFSFQIYADFSGYSDIAIGTARLFGFDLKQNFAFPYFSRDIGEFWRRWHISLSTWFRDYLYIPLGGSQGNVAKVVRNTFVIFIVSGFWHGANWTFVIWGLLNALYFLPLLLTKQNRRNLDIVAEGKWFPSLKELLLMLSTFCLTVLAWVFFRAETVTQALHFIRGIFNESFFSVPDGVPVYLVVLLLLFILIEWVGRTSKHALQTLSGVQFRLMRWTAYAVIIITIYLAEGKETEFIYFQF